MCGALLNTAKTCSSVQARKTMYKVHEVVKPAQVIVCVLHLFLMTYFIDTASYYCPLTSLLIFYLFQLGGFIDLVPQSGLEGVL